ncbi:MAG TPA: hypothetical protein VLD59_05095 [Steroidobacteraceae bacterium]|nr:hypothetical protein [Steroidobacteraceae bacterium]
MPRRYDRDATGSKVSALTPCGRGTEPRAQRRSELTERELAEWFQTLTDEQQDQWLCLVRVLSRAERRGDEFTWRRFYKLARPGWELASVLPELERPVGRRIRAHR